MKLSIKDLELEFTPEEIQEACQRLGTGDGSAIAQALRASQWFPHKKLNGETIEKPLKSALPPGISTSTLLTAVAPVEATRAIARPQNQFSTSRIKMPTRSRKAVYILGGILALAIVMGAGYWLVKQSASTQRWTACGFFALAAVITLYPGEKTVRKDGND